MHYDKASRNPLHHAGPGRVRQARLPPRAGLSRTRLPGTTRCSSKARARASARATSKTIRARRCTGAATGWWASAGLPSSPATSSSVASSKPGKTSPASNRETEWSPSRSSPAGTAASAGRESTGCAKTGAASASIRSSTAAWGNMCVSCPRRASTKFRRSCPSRRPC